MRPKRDNLEPLAVEIVFQSRVRGAGYVCSGLQSPGKALSKSSWLEEKSACNIGNMYLYLIQFLFSCQLPITWKNGQSALASIIAHRAQLRAKQGATRSAIR